MVRTAEKLLKEFCPCLQEGQNQLKTLENYCLMATPGVCNAEKAVNVFIKMAKNEVRILKVFSYTFLPVRNC